MEIVVYGTGPDAVKFTLMNKDVKIKAFVEGKRKIDEFMGRPVVEAESAKELLSKFFVVIASREETYWEIKNILEKQGLIEFDNFTYWTLFKKKIAVIYGNCHTRPIKEAMSAVGLFREQYGFYPLRQIQEIKNRMLLDLKSEVFEHCDLFIHQSIRNDNSYGLEYASEYLVSRLKDECRIIAIPNLYGLPKCIFQQLNLEKPFVVHENCSMFPFRDKYIDECYNTKTVAEIVDIIRDPNLISAETIRDEFEQFINKVQRREVEWDIKVSGYIRKNIKFKKLFYDQNHPSEVLIKYIVEDVLKCLNISKENLDFTNIRALDIYEIPVYETVRKALGLQYDNQLIRKNMRWNLCAVQMDLEEYVKQYICWNFYNNQKTNKDFELRG